MQKTEIENLFAPVLRNLRERSCVADRFIDKDLFRINIATLWANMVLDPTDAGLEESDLERLHDYLNQEIAGVLGSAEDLNSCFKYLNSKAGAAAMSRARLSRNHRDMLLYFCSMILDPEGHRRWMQEISE